MFQKCGEKSIQELEHTYKIYKTNIIQMGIIDYRSPYIVLTNLQFSYIIIIYIS